MDHDWQWERIGVVVVVGEVVSCLFAAMDNLIIKSFRAGVVLCAIVFVHLGMAVRRIGFPQGQSPFQGTRLAAYPYVMACFTVVVLVAIIKKTPNKLEKQFFAIALCTYLVEWFTLGLAPRAVLPLQYAGAFLSLLLALTSLGILKDLAKPLFQEAQARRMERENKRIGG